MLLEGIGKHVKGNLLYIIKELQKEEYQDFKIYVSVNKKTKTEVERFLKIQGVENIHLVEAGSSNYRMILETAEFLVNEVHFPNYWIKKNDQKSVNIWHGTPLKTLGAGKKGGIIHHDGTAQKNFISADYLLFPNDFTKQKLLGDCFVENLITGSILKLGYPRTGAMLGAQAEDLAVKAELAPNGENIIAYMPTYRDHARAEMQASKIRELFDVLEAQLPGNYLMYVNLHHKMASKVNYGDYTKIKEFPKKLDTYQVLAVTDCLCTDYSSLMFDFAATHKKIVLYCYDLEEYVSDRGLYLKPEELPFGKAQNPEELLTELITEKQYDDKVFCNEFCKYDTAHNTEYLCRSVFLGEKDLVETESGFSKDHRITMVYSDGWHCCTATEKMYELAEKIAGQRDIYLSYKDTFVNSALDSAYPLLNYFKSIGVKGRQLFTTEQKKIRSKYHDGKISFQEAMSYLESAYKTEPLRCYCGIEFERFILYDTVDPDKIIGFSYLNCTKYLVLHEDQKRLIDEGNQYFIDAIYWFENQGGIVIDELKEDELQRLLGVGVFN